MAPNYKFNYERVPSDDFSSPVPSPAPSLIDSGPSPSHVVPVEPVMTLDGVLKLYRQISDLEVEFNKLQNAEVQFNTLWKMVFEYTEEVNARPDRQRNSIFLEPMCEHPCKMMINKFLAELDARLERLTETKAWIQKMLQYSE